MPVDVDNLAQYYTFKEIDLEFSCPKGTAFRAFKAIESLNENQDFYYFNADQSATIIDKLKSANRIYSTTVNAVLLSQSGYDKIRNYLCSA